MNTSKRNRIQIASTVDPELWQCFKGLSEKTRIPASRLLDEAVEDLLLSLIHIYTFRKGVLALKPAKAEPLFPPAEE